jgi:hypothetical protein
MTLPHEPDGADYRSWPLDDGPSELIQRLRALRWPEVTPAVRQRCWEELSRQLADLSAPHGSLRASHDGADAEAGPRSGGGRHGGSEGLRERRFGRHEFANRVYDGGYRGALGQRVALARRSALPRPR